MLPLQVITGVICKRLRGKRFPERGVNFVTHYLITHYGLVCLTWTRESFRCLSLLSGQIFHMETRGVLAGIQPEIQVIIGDVAMLVNNFTIILDMINQLS